MEPIQTKGTIPIESDREMTENLISSLQSQVEELKRERDVLKEVIRRNVSHSSTAPEPSLLAVSLVMKSDYAFDNDAIKHAQEFIALVHQAEEEGRGNE